MPEAHWPLERYRPLLQLQVRQLQIDPRLRQRFDESDLVQEALLKAHENLPNFHADAEPAVVAWLGQILINVLTDAVRREHAQKRDVALERSLEAAVADSSARLVRFLAADDTSPSEHAQRTEQLLRLAEAVEKLPADQRDVVIRRDMLDMPIAEIAVQLDRTEKSITGLLLRGRRRLRELLAVGEADQ